MGNRHVDPSEAESRPPELKDIVELARELNLRGAKYVIIGGIAMLQQGFTRATVDIDLLIDGELSNLARVIEAVSTLPDHAAREIEPHDFEQYEVIRIADEVVVDLMVKASNIEYSEAAKGVVQVEIEGVLIPFANAELLLKMKQGVREKDVLDRKFLEAILQRK